MIKPRKYFTVEFGRVPIMRFCVEAKDRDSAMKKATQLWVKGEMPYRSIVKESNYYMGARNPEETEAVK